MPEEPHPLPDPGRNSFYLPGSNRLSGGLVLYKTTIARWLPNALALYFGGPDTDTLTTRRRMSTCLAVVAPGLQSVSRVKTKKGYKHTAGFSTRSYWSAYSFHNRDRCVVPRDAQLLREVCLYSGNQPIRAFIQGEPWQGEAAAECLERLGMESTADALRGYLADAKALGFTEPAEIAMRID